MFSIGNVAISNRVLAAPMAGVTDKAYRIIMKSFGCGMVYTEMISDLGLVYGQERTHHMVDLSGEELPIAVQIFGSEADAMVKAARLVEQKGATIIDINMGCPTPKIVKNGEGSALMRDLPRSRNIIRQVVQAVQVPVTVKMRKGWDDHNESCVELAGIAEQEGASAVAVHGRTREQFYSGQADWGAIARVKKAVTIPVIGNGDIWSADDAVRMIEQTGCDAVMIGRAAMGNPFIFRETVARLEKGEQVPPATTGERVQTAIGHLDLACRFKGEPVAVREMRKHFSWYMKGVRGAARLREEVNQAQTRQELIAIISAINPRL
ncbi:tRNA dihydrouridine synthase DusB [Syntrophomonas erecta]